ncbi:MAG: hypothetical protein KAR45_16090 [Desulfobacteraceae bacterium]|nr:hypothetical protein [Desulfobacteraceae bacterium]
MKKLVILLISILFWSSFIYSSAICASDLSDNFSQKYNDLKPAENSSVRSDYLFEQIALGSEYTIMMLNNLIRENSSINWKTEIIIEKFDILIEQNKKIIELLEKNKKKTDP